MLQDAGALDMKRLRDDRVMQRSFKHVPLNFSPFRQEATLPQKSLQKTTNVGAIVLQLYSVILTVTRLRGRSSSSLAPV